MGIITKLEVSLMVLVFLVIVGACSNEPFGQLSTPGMNVVNIVCKNCHGMDGVGGFAPPLDERIGYSFQNAKQVYDKIRFKMPRNKPGSLSSSEYRQVTSYILVKNGFANEQDIFRTGKLSDIIIPRYVP